MRHKDVQELDDILREIQRLSGNENKIAAFDMDGTLLIGDIGDAVFAELVNEGKLSHTRWVKYQEMIPIDKTEAYKYSVQVMAGLSVGKVIRATRAVLASNESAIIISPIQAKVAIPKPDAMLQSLLLHLGNKGYDIYLVTATNIWTARVVASEHLSIPEDHVIGISTKLLPNKDGGEITAELEEPVPCAEGKVLALKEKLGPRPPLIAAGNNESDYALLEYVKDGGSVIWVNNDDYVNEEIHHVVGESKRLLILDRTVA